MKGIDSLINALNIIPDWRHGRAVQYPLWLMLLMTLLGVMSGYSSLRGLADFMARHQSDVAEYLKLSKAQLPAYSTIREMTQKVDATEVARVFQEWVKATVSLPEGEAVAIDGKALGSTLANLYSSEQAFVMVVSACVQSWSGVIGQVSFDNGCSSEISAVRQLLKQLEQIEMKGVWITLDALHAQKTVTQIVASENHYCMGLKGNQKTLLTTAKQCTQTQVPLSTFQEFDRSHGRQVERTIRVFAAPSELQSQWASLSAFVAVNRQGFREGKPFNSDSWYLLSQIIPASQAAGLIRNHRSSVENQLHWVKD